MNKKEFNTFINDIAVHLNPLNQLLYQSFILIAFYYIFDTISHLQSHKSFIILIAVICIILDVCIWNNITQTTLFIAILTIYITYNIHKDITVDTFINTINNVKDKYNDNIKKLWKKEELYRKNKDEIEKITFTPKNFNDLIKKQSNQNNQNNTNNTNNENNTNTPEPFDKSQSDINEINLAYKESKPVIHLTDSKYARVMLHKLYDTPQYQNIKKNRIDKALDDNIHFRHKNNKNNKHNNGDDIALFRNPKQEFLDNKWLTNENNSYNDNCKTNCIDNNNTVDNKNNKNNNNNNNKYRNKNAICSLVKFGYELSECTNQDNTITEKQLDTISSNNVVIVN